MMNKRDMLKYREEGKRKGWPVERGGALRLGTAKRTVEQEKSGSSDAMKKETNKNDTYRSTTSNNPAYASNFRTTLTVTTATEKSNFISTNLVLNGNAPSAFRPIIPSTSSDSFVVTTLNSLISPSDHESEQNHHHHHLNHHHQQQQQQQQQQNDGTVNGDYGEFIIWLV
ncbi:unnamed protein product [Cercopithifilaria johnstoni]|uniref:Uncharacterized protein n=1 Tax=Cercopithifilaria johnstoni TaxID=2874296 RepID=A0A8J2MCY0_9BILA|nr:unnamed protein product [Cercopithifilaria johnstoni]